MYHGDTPMIHNGADDNASGTSAVMELARYFKNAGKKKNNYLFINFSGEEEGLLGSSYFTKSNAFDLSKVNYMLNLDMVGRYDSSKVGLNIIGTGTSSLWDTLIGMTSHPGLKIEKTRSGVDGSDQLSFYVKEIPILFFFTGIHPDYHKPTDDADKINYAGEAAIIKYAEKIIEKADSMGKIPFTKTTDASSMKRTSLKVTLGVVPDHSFDGKGMRIEAVLDDRPAIKGGLLAGDIVIKIGEHEVTEIMSYMKGLNFYKKGDKVTVTVKRGEQIITKEVQF
jgi:Zn-dependent M28 family amino/carboxypeptidase